MRDDADRMLLRARHMFARQRVAAVGLARTGIGTWGRPQAEVDLYDERLLLHLLGEAVRGACG